MNSNYNIHFSVVSSDETSEVYPAYKGICLHLVGKVEGEAINIKVMPYAKNLMIQMDAVNLSEINKLFKKPFKKFIKNCQLSSDENTEVVFGYSTPLSYPSNENHSILPYYRFKKYFNENEFDTTDIMKNMEDAINFLIQAKKLYEYLQILSGNAAVKSNTLQKTMDEILFKKFEDSKMIILAETILKSFSETSMRLKLIDNDIIHMELVNSSVEIFLSDDEFCNIVADLGAINPNDRDELISGELQPFLNLDSGENGYLYVDDKGNLRYTLMFDYKKTSSKRLAKLIEKRVSFAMQLKQKYQDYAELVYGNEE